MAVTEDVLVGTKAVVVVVAAVVVVVVVAVLVVCTDLSQLGQRSHEGVNVGSKLKRAVAGRHPGPVRCRVPYWRDASP